MSKHHPSRRGFLKSLGRMATAVALGSILRFVPEVHGVNAQGPSPKGLPDGWTSQALSPTATEALETVALQHPDVQRLRRLMTTPASNRKLGLRITSPDSAIDGIIMPHISEAGNVSAHAYILFASGRLGRTSPGTLPFALAVLPNGNVYIVQEGDLKRVSTGQAETNFSNARVNGSRVNDLCPDNNCAPDCSQCATPCGAAAIFGAACLACIAVCAPPPAELTCIVCAIGPCTDAEVAAFACGVCLGQCGAA